MTRTVKAQITSMDIVIGVIILMILLGVIIIILTTMTIESQSREIYGGQVFSNIEDLNDSISFIINHRIDETRLDAFSKRSYENEIKNDILSGSNIFNSYENDLCIFFEGPSGYVQVNGTDALGETLQPPGKSTCNHLNPCEFYKQSFVFVKPVLRQDEIVNMYIVVCE